MAGAEQVRLEVLRFMRSQYKLDELADTFYAAPCLKFRQGQKTILTLIPHEDHCELLIIFGRAEREAFETARDTFPPEIRRIYDETRTLHDGKWMFFRVEKPEDFEPIKQLIHIKKKPNRKPIFSKCGMRCDLCQLYRPNVEKADRRAELCAVFAKVWPGFEEDPRAAICDGCTCAKPDAALYSPDCAARKCVIEKGLPHCGHCDRYPCAIFPSEPGHEELVKKIDVEQRWTWDDELFMEAYACRKNMDAFRKESSR